MVSSVMEVQQSTFQNSDRKYMVLMFVLVLPVFNSLLGSHTTWKTLNFCTLLFQVWKKPGIWRQNLEILSLKMFFNKNSIPYTCQFPKMVM